MVNDPARHTVVRHVFLSSLSNYVGKFINLGIWFLLTPFILNQLGEASYGLWILVGSVVAYGFLLDFGIASAVTKYVAEYHSRGEGEIARSLVATALWTNTGVGLLIMLASVLLAPVFAEVFEFTPAEQKTAIWLFLLAGVGVGITIPCATTTAVLRGLQRFDLMNLIGVTATLVSAGGTVLVLVLGGGVIGLAIVNIAVPLLMQVPSIWFIYRIAPELHFGFLGASRRTFHTITSFSSSMFMLQVGGHLETKTDEIVIGVFLPVNAVTPYNLARRLSSLPQILTEQFLTLLLPLASKLYAENDQVRIRSLYLVSTRLTLATFLPVGVSLVFLAGPFLTIWVGAEFANYANLVLILSLASMIDTTTWPAGSILQGMGLPRFSGIMSIVTGLANLVLSLVLVQRIGLTGVALGTLLPTIIFCLGFTHPYVTQVIGVPIQKVFSQVLLPALIPALPASIGIYLLQRVLELNSILSILLVGASGLLIYLAVYLGMGSNEFERDVFRNVLMEIAHRTKLYRTESNRYQ